jgi:SAM-dependent methyltransferase
MATDSATLEQQYRDGSNLAARIALHARYSTATYNFHDWLFDFVVRAGPRARILELGCGTGQMWSTVRARVPASWQLVLTDFSQGMLSEVGARLAVAPFTACFALSDAQAIPFPGDHFDVVIANHMLYHIPSLPRALAEIRRVLKPGARLVAATNGAQHMRELGSLADAMGSDMALWRELSFSLDNGAGLLAPYFALVERYDFTDSLHVTDAEPLVAYILSMRAAMGHLDIERTQQLRELATQRIARDGAFDITKASGLFVATK